jgi:hypothetical protein
MSITLNASTSSGFVQSADNSGEIELQSNGTTALKVNTNEGIQILNCLGVGNATPSTSGAGITFPATQSASTDANTLDDYEEGTWTPTSPTATFSSATGQYVKVGQMVTVSFRCVFNAITNSNQATISLPFTAVAGAVGNSHYHSGCPLYQTTGLPVIVYGVLENTNRLEMFDGGGGAVNYTTFSAKQINGSITYRTSA